MCIDLFVTQGDQGEDGVVDFGLAGGGRVAFGGCLPGCGDAYLVFQLHDDPFGRLFPDAFDLGEGLGVAGNDGCLEAGHRGSAENIERGFGADAGDMPDEKSEKVAFRGGCEAKKHMGIFPDLEVGEQSQRGPGCGKAVVAGEGNQNVVADAMDIQHDMGGVRLDQNAFEEGDHVGEIRREVRGRQALRILVGWLWVCLGGAALAEGGEWRVWMEARFMRPAMSAALPGAERTVIAGGRWDGEELRAFSKKEWEALGVDWATFEKEARRQSVRDWEGVEIRLERDKRKVIQFAELRSKQPLVASAVLAPGFGERFADTLGDRLWVVVPNRFQAFVFPKLAGAYEKYAGMVLQSYAATAYPVSLEVLEWSRDGWRAVGIFDPQ
ncbi:MAG: hypothetical protein RLZZ399_448 [Verrucomicrobiota bacterium]